MRPLLRFRVPAFLFSGYVLKVNIGYAEKRDLTQDQASDSKPTMGRKLLWPEHVNLSLAKGVKDRIAAVLRDGEDRLSFIREAIERELKRRERQKPDKAE